jgi:hypothetical protein
MVSWGRVMRDLLRKPPREIPTPCEGIEQRQDDEEAKQKRINSIIARALAFMHPKRPASRRKHLGSSQRKNSKDIRFSEVIEDEEGSVRSDGQAFPYGQGGRAVANEARRCPTRFDST